MIVIKGIKSASGKAQDNNVVIFQLLLLRRLTTEGRNKANVLFNSPGKYSQYLLYY